jgi:hypothetical protein
MPPKKKKTSKKSPPKRGSKKLPSPSAPKRSPRTRSNSVLKKASADSTTGKTTKAKTTKAKTTKAKSTTGKTTKGTTAKGKTTKGKSTKGTTAKGKITKSKSATGQGRGRGKVATRKSPNRDLSKQGRKQSVRLPSPPDNWILQPKVGKKKTVRGGINYKGPPSPKGSALHRAKTLILSPSPEKSPLKRSPVKRSPVKESPVKKSPVKESPVKQVLPKASPVKVKIIEPVETEEQKKIRKYYEEIAYLTKNCETCSSDVENPDEETIKMQNAWVKVLKENELVSNGQPLSHEEAMKTLDLLQKTISLHACVHFVIKDSQGEPMVQNPPLNLACVQEIILESKAKQQPLMYKGQLVHGFDIDLATPCQILGRAYTKAGLINYLKDKTEMSEQMLKDMRKPELCKATAKFILDFHVQQYRTEYQRLRNVKNWTAENEAELDNFLKQIAAIAADLKIEFPGPQTELVFRTIFDKKKGSANLWIEKVLNIYEEEVKQKWLTWQKGAGITALFVTVAGLAYLAKSGKLNFTDVSKGVTDAYGAVSKGVTDAYGAVSKGVSESASYVYNQIPSASSILDRIPSVEDSKKWAAQFWNPATKNP